MCGKTVPSYGPPNPAQAAAGQPTSLSTSYEPKAPQLSVAINTSPVPEPIQQDLPVDAASTITTIVRQIYDRLKGGLAMVWDGPDGHDPEWAPKTPEDSKHYPSGICRTSATTVEEEAWARACSKPDRVAVSGSSRSAQADSSALSPLASGISNQPGLQASPLGV